MIHRSKNGEKYDEITHLYGKLDTLEVYISVDGQLTPFFSSGFVCKFQKIFKTDFHLNLNIRCNSTVTIA